LPEAHKIGSLFPNGRPFGMPAGREGAAMIEGPSREAIELVEVK